MKWLTIVIFVTVIGTVKAQSLNKKYIDEHTAKFNPNLANLPVAGYIVDGRAFSPADSLKLDSNLKNWILKKVLCIDAYKTDDILPTAGNPGKIVVIIVSKGRQSKKEKDQLFTEAVAKYSSELYFDHISSDSKEPALRINDRDIFFSNCKNELSKIKLAHVYAINIYRHPVPAEFYGQNAKNGLIEIWTGSGNKVQ